MENFEVKTRGVEIQSIKDKKPNDGHRPKSPEDIVALIFLIKLIKFMPNGIGRLLPKLLTLRVNNCELKEIKQADLMELPYLRKLDLSSNDIEVIDKDLFKFNSKLERIILDFNNIKKIDGNVFDDLKYLKVVSFTANHCIQHSTIVDNIQRIINIIREKCSGIAEETKNYENKETKEIKPGISRGRKYWIFVGFGVVAGVMVAVVLVVMIYRIIKPTI